MSVSRIYYSNNLNQQPMAPLQMAPSQPQNMTANPQYNPYNSYPQTSGQQGVYQPIYYQPVYFQQFIYPQGPYQQISNQQMYSPLTPPPTYLQATTPRPTVPPLIYNSQAVSHQLNEGMNQYLESLKEEDLQKIKRELQGAINHADYPLILFYVNCIFEVGVKQAHPNRDMFLASNLSLIFQIMPADMLAKIILGFRQNQLSANLILRLNSSELLRIYFLRLRDLYTQGYLKPEQFSSLILCSSVKAAVKKNQVIDPEFAGIYLTEISDLIRGNWLQANVHDFLRLYFEIKQFTPIKAGAVGVELVYSQLDAERTDYEAKEINPKQLLEQINSSAPALSTGLTQVQQVLISSDPLLIEKYFKFLERALKNDFDHNILEKLVLTPSAEKQSCFYFLSQQGNIKTLDFFLQFILKTAGKEGGEKILKKLSDQHVGFLSALNEPERFKPDAVNQCLNYLLQDEYNQAFSFLGLMLYYDEIKQPRTPDDKYIMIRDNLFYTPNLLRENKEELIEAFNSPSAFAGGWPPFG